MNSKNSPLEDATISLGKKVSPGKIQFFLMIFVFSLLFYHLGKINLQEPSETRIASASRYMADTSNYIIPVTNGNPDFSIPPLSCWLTATGIKIFGNNEFAVRFFIAIAGILTVLTTHKIGILLFGPRTALLSSFVLITSSIFALEFRKLGIYPFAQLWQALMILCLFKVYYRNAGNNYILAFWFFLSLSFLTEGTSSLLSLAGILPFLSFAGKTDNLKRLLYNKFGWLIFLSSGLGWYFYISFSINGAAANLFSTWLVLPFTNIVRFNENQVPFFVIWAAIFCFFPWTFFFIAGINKSFREVQNSDNEIHMLLLSWLAIPGLLLALQHDLQIGEILKLILPYSFICGNYLASKLHLAQDESFSFKFESALTIVAMASQSLLFIYASWSGAIPDPSLSKVTFFLSLHFLFIVFFGYSSIQMDFTKGMILGLAITIPGIVFFVTPGLTGDEQYWNGKYFAGSREILEKASQIQGKDKIYNLCSKIFGSYFYSGGKIQTLDDAKQLLNASEGANIIIPTDDAEYYSQISRRKLNVNFSKGPFSICSLGKSLIPVEDKIISNFVEKIIKPTAASISEKIFSNIFSAGSASMEIASPSKLAASGTNLLRESLILDNVDNSSSTNALSNLAKNKNSKNSKKNTGQKKKTAKNRKP
ncbi:MAG: glycosyltransferase family 39 protein [Candidatus Riflebacteria bacterium]|nr:glycosyltransferase family 39 protein [Candidatus Riflebacteria bacterium]